jgi:hypothetical protein
LEDFLGGIADFFFDDLGLGESVSADLLEEACS